MIADEGDNVGGSRMRPERAKKMQVMYTRGTVHVHIALLRNNAPGYGMRRGGPASAFAWWVALPPLSDRLSDAFVGLTLPVLCARGGLFRTHVAAALAASSSSKHEFVVLAGLSIYGASIPSPQKKFRRRPPTHFSSLKSGAILFGTKDFFYFVTLLWI